MSDTARSYEHDGAGSGSFEDDAELADILCQASLISEHAKMDQPTPSPVAPMAATATDTTARTATTVHDAKSTPSTPGSSSKTPTPRSSTASLRSRQSENIQTICRAKNRVHTKVASITAASRAAPESQRRRCRRPLPSTPQYTRPETIHALSKPKTTSTQRAFASDEDARQCRFQPKKTRSQLAAMKNPACGYDFVNHFEDEDAGPDDFIARMEAAEHNRQKRLQATRGEEEYSLRQNKKQCPRCGMTQSYAEFRDKKKRCTFCGVLFALPKAWGDIGTDFLERMELSVDEKKRRHEAIRANVIALETQANRVPKSAKQRYYERAIEANTSHRAVPSTRLAFAEEP
ncbi:hypothetical protein SPRG_04806 [Saprolegnia parasitica CBS 223.65]|uniref:Uncharacterized protein n=1 Tax=Saprolegnia parasitica (strain CBS 223.65) TaxID=695850 RepID=A0A067CK62_SAPPC|nr:hypothetical protein SPRG_04806 [Saprolegnia parasitica CBS 223.65]KDO30903.1 hypothetical protein SPRG_04806 [Saprolegnia parasitica CBS 223.65]|eukprot:XP_012198596.1 hypothetical protein SPRG_04806 [Saprolegnia parasitica CBS 223.65]